MLLLHVHSGNLFGGVETMLLAFAECRGPLEHRFALCWDGRLAAELRAHGAAVEILGATRARYPLSILLTRRRLAAILAASRFDAAVCHMPWPQALFAPVIRRAGIPQLFWMHDAASGRHWVERWAQWTTPDFALCNSAYTESTLPRLYPSTPHAVLYPPLRSKIAPASREARDAARRSLATAPDSLVIVQASRLEPWKGHRVLLEALHRLRDIPGWTCWIAGAPQRPVEEAYLQMLKQQVQHLALEDRVRFCGFQPDIRDLLEAADIYCQLHTRAEPFGLALAEAMAAGLAVLTANTGGAAELVDSGCGILVAPCDPNAAATALRGLLRDRERRRALSAAGRARAMQACDPDAANQQLATIIARLGHADRAAAVNQ